MQLHVHYISAPVYHRSSVGCVEPGGGGGVKHETMYSSGKWESKTACVVLLQRRQHNRNICIFLYSFMYSNWII
jgi:hypothetical protein